MLPEDDEVDVDDGIDDGIDDNDELSSPLRMSIDPDDDSIDTDVPDSNKPPWLLDDSLLTTPPSALLLPPIMETAPPPSLLPIADPPTRLNKPPASFDLAETSNDDGRILEFNPSATVVDAPPDTNTNPPLESKTLTLSPPSITRSPAPFKSFFPLRINTDPPDTPDPPCNTASPPITSTPLPIT